LYWSKWRVTVAIFECLVAIAARVEARMFAGQDNLKVCVHKLAACREMMKASDSLGKNESHRV
jgi:hypothetical protein